MAITAAETARELLYIGELRGVRDITNLKLQKLLYFTNLVHISILDTPLFSDNVSAWKLGPVVGTVYYDYKVFKNTQITGRSEKTNNKILEQSVALVMDLFGWKPASDLVDITHLDSVYEAAIRKENRIMKHSKPEAMGVISTQIKGIFDRAKYMSLAGRLNSRLAIKDRPYIDDYAGVPPQERRKIWGVADE